MWGCRQSCSVVCDMHWLPKRRVSYHRGLPTKRRVGVKIVFYVTGVACYLVLQALLGVLAVAVVVEHAQGAFFMRRVVFCCGKGLV